jgi:hypothetical protein
VSSDDVEISNVADVAGPDSQGLQRKLLTMLIRRAKQTYRIREKVKSKQPADHISENILIENQSGSDR